MCADDYISYIEESTGGYSLHPKAIAAIYGMFDYNFQGECGTLQQFRDFLNSMSLPQTKQEMHHLAQTGQWTHVNGKSGSHVQSQDRSRQGQAPSLKKSHSRHQIAN